MLPVDGMQMMAMQLAQTPVMHTTCMRNPRLRLHLEAAVISLSTPTPCNYGTFIMDHITFV